MFFLPHLRPPRAAVDHDARAAGRRKRERLVLEIESGGGRVSTGEARAHRRARVRRHAPPQRRQLSFHRQAGVVVA